MKKLLFIILITTFILFFLLNPTDAFDASKNGLMLWFNQILPTLLPFAVISGVLLSSSILSESKIFQKNAGLFVIICGFLFGFPIGSKLASDLQISGKLTQKEGELIAAFTNNFSPFFVTSFVIHNQLQMAHLTWIFYLILYGIPLVFGSIALFFLKRKEMVLSSNDIKKASRFQLNIQIIDASIISSFETLIKLCGYIILFSILVQMIQSLTLPSPYIETGIVGILEITNGIQTLALSSFSESQKFLLSILFLGFGGLSGIMQTNSVISNSTLSIKNYIKIKLILLALQMLVGIIFLFICPQFLYQ